jgi:nucleotide-binding universal stress UspA family protein
VASNLIVVGVDGSEGGRRALRWAVAEAHRTEAAVKAVTAWSWDPIMDVSPQRTSRARQRERAESISAREVAILVADVGTAVPVTREVLEGAEDRVLTGAAQGARMLVLGSHGYGHFHHALSDSVGARCIRRSTCPVVVVPAPLTPASSLAESLAAGRG